MTLHFTDHGEYQEESDGMLYFHHNASKTRSVAFGICRSEGASLPIVKSFGTQRVINDKYSDREMWLALNDMKTMGDWRWTRGDKTTERLRGYTNWKRKEPTTGSVGRLQRCVKTKVHWNNYPCITTMQFLCQKRKTGRWFFFLFGSLQINQCRCCCCCCKSKHK